MKLDNLVSDIYKLFDPNEHHIANEDNLQTFAENLKQTLRTRLSQREERGETLRFSNLGQPDRKVWYMAHGEKPEEMTAKTYFKFLYGDVIEQILLFLAKEAGHDVTHEQHEVNVSGVLGHIDAIIDGVVVDVKSASPYGYKKFEENSIVGDDPFGYIQQISGYANVLTPGEAPAFLAFNKVNGDICLTPVSTSIVEDHKPEDRIEHLRNVIASPVPPERCYPDVPDGKSGNMKLDTGCSYCGFKSLCWPELRVFLYSTGPRFLTKTVREPDVYEVKGEPIEAEA